MLLPNPTSNSNSNSSTHNTILLTFRNYKWHSEHLLLRWINAQPRSGSWLWKNEATMNSAMSTTKYQLHTIYLFFILGNHFKWKAKPVTDQQWEKQKLTCDVSCFKKKNIITRISETKLTNYFLRGTLFEKCIGTVIYLEAFRELNEP